MQKGGKTSATALRQGENLVLLLPLLLLLLLLLLPRPYFHYFSRLTGDKTGIISQRHVT